MTHRQFMAWQSWITEDMNKPGKLEHYMMQNACEVRRVLSKSPKDIKLDQFELKFVTKKSGQSDSHTRNVAAMAKSVWVKRMHSRVRYIEPEPSNMINPDAQQPDYQDS